MQLLSDPLRKVGEKAGFNEDGWTDGNCTLIRTTEARGHRVPSSSRHKDPLRVEGDTAVGLNTGRPDGAPGLETPGHLCALENHSMGSRERGLVLTPLRQTALSAAQARTCLRRTSALTLYLPRASRPSATWHPRRGEKHLIPLLGRPCPRLGASLRVCALVLVTLECHCLSTPCP